MASDRMLRWLCWGLVVVAVISAVSQLLLTFNIWAGGPSEPPEGADLIARLEIFRANDQEIWGLVLVGSIASLIAFALVGLIGVLLRAYSAAGSTRDVMVTLLVMAAIVGVLSQLASLATSQVAAGGYCDCGFKTEELIGQAYALNLGNTIFVWTVNAAFVLTGLGVWLAGRLVNVSNLWRMLSYLIAVALIATAVVRIALPIFFLPEELFQITDIVSGLTLAVLVPIWAILLTRDGSMMSRTTAA